MTEQEHLECIQDALKDIKKSLREVQMINFDADRKEAANAAMGFRGKVITLHAEMTGAMDKFYPEMSSGIQVRGGGGSR